MNRTRNRSMIEVAMERALTRSLHDIAWEVTTDWERPYFGAIPYLLAMAQLDKIGDEYGADSGRYVVAGFLSNARNWRGETARRVKAELNGMLRQ